MSIQESLVYFCVYLFVVYQGQHKIVFIKCNLLPGGKLELTHHLSMVRSWVCPVRLAINSCSTATPPGRGPYATTVDPSSWLLYKDAEGSSKAAKIQWIKVTSLDGNNPTTAGKLVCPNHFTSNISEGKNKNWELSTNRFVSACKNQHRSFHLLPSEDIKSSRLT